MLDKPKLPKIDPITFEVDSQQAPGDHRGAGHHTEVGFRLAGRDRSDRFQQRTLSDDGSIVTMGPQVIFHTGTMSTVIRSIIDNFSENPGIKEGDMFILNDPYRGAIHQPDVSIVAPIFIKGSMSPGPARAPISSTSAA